MDFIVVCMADNQAECECCKGTHDANDISGFGFCIHCSNDEHGRCNG